MHQELSRREGVSPVGLTLWILAAAFVLIALNTMLYRVQADSAMTDFLIIGISTGGLFALIKKNMVSYKYSIIEDEFIVHEVVGSKEKIVLNLNVSQILKFDKADGEQFKEDRQKDYTYRRRLYNCSNKSNRHYIVYEEDGEKKWFTFQPSDRMLELIKEKI